MTRIASALRNLFLFYYDGFRTMSWWGRKVWIIILIKVCIIFLLLRLFFFPDFLRTNFSSDDERSNYVIEQLTGNKLQHD